MKSASTNRRNIHNNRVASVMASQAKEPLNLMGYQGAIEVSHPAKFRGWVFIPELAMIAEAYANDKIELGTRLLNRIAELKIIVPARKVLFARIEELITEKFDTPRTGYEFLNSAQNEWRSASTETLAELIKTLENFEGEQSPESFAESGKGFVLISRSKIQKAKLWAAGKDFSCNVRKLDIGVYEVESHTSGEVYLIELNRGFFGVTAHCPCADFTFTRLQSDEVCKHICAVYQFERQGKVISFSEQIAA